MLKSSNTSVNTELRNNNQDKPERMQDSSRPPPDSDHRLQKLHESFRKIILVSTAFIDKFHFLRILNPISHRNFQEIFVFP